MKQSRGNFRHPCRGFSILELLIVCAIIGLLAVMTIPALTSVLMGSALTRAGDSVRDTIALARQEALAKNRDVQVWFFADAGGSGMAAARIDDGESGPSTNLVIRPFRFPDRIVLSTNGGRSPLLDSGGVSGQAAAFGKAGVPFRGFRIRADGSLDASVGSNNFVTLQSANETADPPRNYYAVQINPFTAKISIFRP